MTFRTRWLAACLVAFATTASSQSTSSQTTSTPTTTSHTTSGPEVVLSSIQVTYPEDAEAKRASGTVRVRVDVRPIGSVARTTKMDGAPVLSGAAMVAASRARFQCRECPEPSTPHVITFVFSLEGLDSAGNPLPVAWKQTGDASSEVTVYGRALVLSNTPTRPQPHDRAARCLWLWHCSRVVVPVK